MEREDNGDVDRLCYSEETGILEELELYRTSRISYLS
jgi:hypothetical protein